MAKKGFKPKLDAIISSDAERNSRLVCGPEEPTPHSPTPYRTFLQALLSNTGSPSFEMLFLALKLLGYHREK